MRLLISPAYGLKPTKRESAFDSSKPSKIWAMVMEKAFTYFRDHANTYASISAGYMSEAFADLGAPSSDFTPGFSSDAQLFQMLSTDLKSGDPVAMSTDFGSDLVSNHAYTLIAVTTVHGVNHYAVRNPWGFSGDTLENGQGIATLTYTQFIANFTNATAAMG